MKSKRADFLFATPSAISGMARFFDFSGSFDVYNSSRNEAEADAKATYVDWACVGASVDEAMHTLFPADLQLTETFEPKK
jgi:hypothetical protein